MYFTRISIFNNIVWLYRYLFPHFVKNTVLSLNSHQGFSIIITVQKYGLLNNYTYYDMSVKRSFDTHLIPGLLRSYAAPAILQIFEIR